LIIIFIKGLQKLGKLILKQGEGINPRVKRMMSLPQAITVSNLDHLGLVAGMGEYESSLPEVYFLTQEASATAVNEVEINQIAAPQPITITYGYSRDHRPDLKQFILDLICTIKEAQILSANTDTGSRR
jgi:hypothetical protein